MATIDIFNRKIGDGQPVFVIAEIGINHQGKEDLAHQLIDAAADAGADAVKFQKRSLQELYQQKILENPNLGEQAFQYLMPILKEMEFDEAAYRRFKDHAVSRNLKFLATAWETESLEFIDRIGVEAFKVASGDFTNFLLLEEIIKKGKPLIVSTAMAQDFEIEKTVAYLRERGARFAMLHCVGAYPTPPEDQNLRFIPELKRRFPDVPIGFSGHERGFNATLGAVALGATVVERHITPDRYLEGPDHLASLDPAQFKDMVTSIREITLALGVPKKIHSHIEAANRKVLGKALYAARSVAAGVVITRGDLVPKSPAKGLAVYRYPELIGKPAMRAKARDEAFTEEDLGAAAFKYVRPDYKTPWGLKTRFSEIDFAEQFDPDILEFHLSDKDIEEGFTPKKKYRARLFAHAADYMGRRIKDLASLDDELWNDSIKFFQQTIDLIRRLAPNFSGPPAIVLHVGGSNRDKPTADDPRRLLDRSYLAFRRLSYDGVVLLPENVPPVGWYYSGQWWNTVFADVEEVISFTKELGFKLCFDTAHARLACNVLGRDYREFVEKIAPHTAYVQVADAAGRTHEALQIGDGEIDFAETFAILNRHPGWSWCPEIWEGHLDGYRGFLTALEKLRPYIP